MVTGLPNATSKDQPLVGELPLLATVMLATKPLPQLFRSTLQLTASPPPLDEELEELLEELELDDELLFDELEPDDELPEEPERLTNVVTLWPSTDTDAELSDTLIIPSLLTFLLPEVVYFVKLSTLSPGRFTVRSRGEVFIFTTTTAMSSPFL